MKKLISTAFFLVFVLFINAQSKHFASKPENKNTTLTAAHWQSDLRHLQHVVNTDYSFLFKNISKKDFDAEVEKLNTAIPTMQPHEILAGFARIVS